MPDSNLLFYIASELAILLLLVCIFLLLHVRKLKALVAKLEEKIQSLRQSLGFAKRDAQEARNALAEREKIKPKLFADYIEQYIDDTREHHQSLNPDRDIVLDISPDAPLDRQADSLRHALLIAEKEADYAGGDGAPDWGVLQAKYQQILEFFSQSGDAVTAEQPDTEVASGISEEEHELLKQRVENLERFKKLFFDMESKWQESKNLAEDYHEQLMALGVQIGGGELFQELMDKYASAFDEVGNLIESGPSAEAGNAGSRTVIEIDNRSSSVGKMVIANQEEMQRLRNMAVDQHKVITELKKQLAGADSIEEQQAVVEKLTEQLERQERFLKEAETCSQLLEDELSRTLEENQQLRAELDGGVGGNTEELEGLVNQLTDQSRDMLGTIASLEEENRSLKEAAGSGADSAELQAKLSNVQQELLNLQTQHIELEERYLELKMNG